MPSWNIHLEAGERLASHLKLSGKKRKEFLLGCLLPDINNGYVNKAEIIKEHRETHYAFDQKSSLNFYGENKTEIDNRTPIFLGYLFHLFTDGFFNYNFYHNFKHSPLSRGISPEEKTDIKHHDFWLYDTNFHHALNVTAEEAAALATTANQINAVEISAREILDVDEIMKSGKLSQSVKKEPYIFYSEQELSQVLDDTLKEFIKQYLGESHA